MKEELEKIKNCRLCNQVITGSDTVLDLGSQALTGIFIKNGTDVPSCNMSLSMCSNPDCGLVQINEIYDLDMLYGKHYGYSSSLNSSMVEHLKSKADILMGKYPLRADDIIIDIGSNDGTTLSFFPSNTQRVGVDKVGSKFQKKYDEMGADLVADFFPNTELKNKLADRKAKIISSYSCFYDLPDPVLFAKGIADSLDAEGIWCLEQSYMPTMLKTNSFDTVCHEHIEYYRLIDIVNICEAADLRVISMTLNDINGGSFSLEVAHQGSSHTVDEFVTQTLAQERATDWKLAFSEFKQRIETCKKELLTLLNSLKSEGKRVAALGASTKGNVLLQHYGIDEELLESVGEVNQEKFDCQTPGSAIRIIPEQDLIASQPDYLLVLPWHFRNFFVNNESLKGQQLIFPLPQVEVVSI